MKSEVEVENYDYEFSDISTTYHMFQSENFKGIYYVHYFRALLLKNVKFHFLTSCMCSKFS